MRIVIAVALLLSPSVVIAQREPHVVSSEKPGVQQSAEEVELRSMLPALQACNRNMDGAGYRKGFESCVTIRARASTLQTVMRDKQNAKDLEAIKSVKVPAK